MFASVKYKILPKITDRKVLNKVVSFPLDHFHFRKKNNSMEVSYRIVENTLNVINRHTGVIGTLNLTSFSVLSLLPPAREHLLLNCLFVFCFAFEDSYD